MLFFYSGRKRLERFLYNLEGLLQCGSMRQKNGKGEGKTTPLETAEAPQRFGSEEERPGCLLGAVTHARASLPSVPCDSACQEGGTSVVAPS